MNDTHKTHVLKQSTSKKITHRGTKVSIDINGMTVTATSIRVAKTTVKEIKTYNNNLSSYYLRDTQEVNASLETAKKLLDDKVRKQYEELRRQLELD